MKERIEGLDLARALAVFGMILVNYYNLMSISREPEESFVSVLASILEGRAAALFVVLAGIGLSLQTYALKDQARHLQLSKQKTIMKRALFLFVVGFLHSWIWDADIIHYYAFFLTFGLLFSRIPNSGLLLSAVLIALLHLFMMLTMNYEQGWDFETLTYVDLWSLEGTFRHLFFNGFHPIIPWIIFILVGLWVGRRLIDKRWDNGLVASGAALLVFMLAFLESLKLFGESAEMTLSPVMLLTAYEVIPPTILFVISSSASAILVISISLFLMSRWRAAPLLQLLCKTGRVSFTLYLGHIIIGLGIAEELGILFKQPDSVIGGYSLFFCVVSMLFAHLWLKRFKNGPIEQLMRILTR